MSTLCQLSAIVRTLHTWPHLILIKALAGRSTMILSFQIRELRLKRVKWDVKFPEVLSAEPGLEWRESDSRARTDLIDAWKFRKADEVPTQHIKERRQGELGRDTLGETQWVRNRPTCALRLLYANWAAEVAVLGPQTWPWAPLCNALTLWLSRGI